jgi:hypothetical protein
VEKEVRRMAQKYRRREDSDTWHFCTNCTLWPTQGYVEHDGKPTTGELCNQCKDKEKNGTCTPKY